MSDLVERLNNDVSLFSNMDWREHVALAREAATEIARLRALNAELVEALEACPLPSTMGNVKTHYDQFYDWYHKHVDPVLTRAKGEA